MSNYVLTDKRTGEIVPFSKRMSWKRRRLERDAKVAAFAILITLALFV